MKHAPVFKDHRLHCICGWSCAPQYKTQSELRAEFKKHEAKWK